MKAVKGMKKNTLTAFGLWVKKGLIEIQMTQRELADAVEVNESYLNQILYGIRSGKKYVDKIRTVIEDQKDKLKKSKTA